MDRQEVTKQISREKSQSLQGGRDNVTVSGTQEEYKLCAAPYQKRALSENLMEEICQISNLNEAYKKVVTNKGAPGIDGMTTEQLEDYIKLNKATIVQLLLNGEYRPTAVKAVEIPKDNKDVRKLGIPTVLDRLVQQAIHQVLAKTLDKEFSNSSYGFRQGKSAHQAISQGQKYVEDGYEYVVDIDIEQFFDNVNHDILMARLARYIGDKRLLKIIRRFLQAGIMVNGVKQERSQGTPQGGPLSPLLSNLLLHDLDVELENRNHKFCRYADDCNIYVKSLAAAQRVKESITKFLAKRLKLKVNEEKSTVDKARNVKFLGFTIGIGKKLIAAKQTITKFKDKIRKITKRNRGTNISTIIGDLNQYTRGWREYFKLDTRKKIYNELDSWIRRRLRCYMLKQKKKPKTIEKWLIKLGISKSEAWKTAYSSKGLWRLSNSPQMCIALTCKWFEAHKLLLVTRT
jgi:RNA-directed DNA polymerase